MKGEIKQQKPEQAKAKAAIDLLLNFRESKPPMRQPKKPEAIIIKDQKETENDLSFNCLKTESTQGTNAQNAYNSHM